MTTFEDILCKVKDLGEAAGKKTGELVEVTRLKMEAAQTEKDITATLEGLGRLIYDGRKSGEDVTEMADACIDRVDELNTQLEELRDKIVRYKNAVRCKDCGSLNTEDSLYCKKCGAKLS